MFFPSKENKKSGLRPLWVRRKALHGKQMPQFGEQEGTRGEELLGVSTRVEN